ncbi:MAG: helix-hairpin-helix domain-containing protein [Phascolarctobacterium sp.]|nr:helix-hairpin-helix domain-containing protein [Phascolarctobacterium sp.]
MDNYKQKLFLLCALLFGCVLTSIGVEYFAEPDEPIQIQAPQFVEQQSKTKSNLQFSAEQSKFTSNLKFLEEQHKMKDNKQFSTPVNINTATIEELDTLPGVGPAIAQRIVDFRKEQPFTKIEDIMLVKGIGKKKFAKLRERITVE